MPYRCRYCNAKVERIRKYCPECGRRMYKGDWIRIDPKGEIVEVKEVKCAYCRGSGRDPVARFLPCSACGGRGYCRLKAPIAKCRVCGGSGRTPGVGFVFCQACGGCGYRTRGT